MCVCVGGGGGGRGGLEAKLHMWGYSEIFRVHYRKYNRDLQLRNVYNIIDGNSICHMYAPCN